MNDFSINLSEVTISVREARFWRDWMPEVEEPGPDGGSPLYTDISLELENTGHSEIRLDFEAVLHLGVKTSNPIKLEARSVNDKKDWSGLLTAGERRLILLSGRTGPYVPADETIWCEIFWNDQAGNKGSVATKEQRVMRVD